MRVARRTLSGFALALALAIGGLSAHARDDGCTLSAATCAKEGIVILAPRADRLIGWRQRTDFHPIRFPRAHHVLGRLGRDQAVVLVLSGSDLKVGHHHSLIRKVADRGGTVIVTRPSLEDAALLDEFADIVGARWPLEEHTRLYGVRKAHDDDGRTHPMALVLLLDTPRGRPVGRRWLKETEVTWLKELIGREPPATIRDHTVSLQTSKMDTTGTPPSSNDLIDLVQAKHLSVLKISHNDALQIDNFVYGARSFLNSEDLFYVEQEVQYSKGSGSGSALLDSNVNNLPNVPNALNADVAVLRPSPQTTLKTTTTRRGSASESEAKRATSPARASASMSRRTSRSRIPRRPRFHRLISRTSHRSA